MVVAHRAPMTHIDLHPWRISVLRLENPVQQELQIFERRAVVSDQKLALSREHLKLASALRLNLLNVGDETEVTQHRVEYFLGFHEGVASWGVLTSTHIFIGSFSFSQPRLVSGLWQAAVQPDFV